MIEFVIDEDGVVRLEADGEDSSVLEDLMETAGDVAINLRTEGKGTMPDVRVAGPARVAALATLTEELERVIPREQGDESVRQIAVRAFDSAINAGFRAVLDEATGRVSVGVSGSGLVDAAFRDMAGRLAAIQRRDTK